MLAIAPFVVSKVCKESKIVLVITAALCVELSRIIHPVYDYPGVLLILTFYIFRNYRPYNIIAAAMLMAATWLGDVQALAIMALPIIFFYNGERGFINTKARKYAFYAVYPLHLLILYGIAQIT